MILEEFYENSDILIRLEEAISDNHSMIEDKLNAKIGDPVVISDMSLARLYELIFSTTVHFYPGRLPASGMTIGSFESQKGRSFLCNNWNVGVRNFHFLHLVRSIEKEIVGWEGVREEASILVEKIKKFLPENLSKISFSDYVGFSRTDTPNKKFLDALQALLQYKKYQSLTADINRVIELSSPFTDLGEKMRQFRDVLKCKSLVFLENGQIHMNSPSSSGGADWTTTGATNDIAKAVPSGNNLFLLIASSGLAPSNISFLGSGKSVKEGNFATFLLSENFIKQMFDSVESKLPQDTSSFDVDSSDDEETICKKATEWFRIQYEVTRDFLLNNLLEFVNGSVLGVNISVSEDKKSLIAQPIVSETHAINYSGNKQIKNFDAVLALFDSELGIPMSVFGTQEIAST